MVMNYDTYLEIDQDSDSGFPGKPGRMYKKRRHDERTSSQKIIWTDSLAGAESLINHER